MCLSTKKRCLWLDSSFLLGVGLFLGAFTGLLGNPSLLVGAEAISEVFMSLLRLVSTPIIFLSLVTAVSGMESLSTTREIGGRTVFYTSLTTVLAASIALAWFLALNPSQEMAEKTFEGSGSLTGKGYLSHVLALVPSSFLSPFLEHNVMSVLILAIFTSLAILNLPEENRTILRSFFQSLFLMVMKITSWIILALPLAMWAFAALFTRDAQGGLALEGLTLYLFCVVLANLTQGLVALPLLLRSRGISPARLARAMFPALSMAFLTKSSSATLPTALRCATERGGIRSSVASSTLPLCVSINMNGCAAFILITTLFVAMSHGISFSLAEMIGWIFVATIAAVGNASVPMGCYFLSSALLAAMDVPLNLMGAILPFYVFIDMLETAINVWSDSVVTAIVDKETRGEALSLEVPVASR